MCSIMRMVSQSIWPAASSHEQEHSRQRQEDNQHVQHHAHRRSVHKWRLSWPFNYSLCWYVISGLALWSSFLVYNFPKSIQRRKREPKRARYASPVGGGREDDDEDEEDI